MRAAQLGGVSCFAPHFGLCWLSREATVHKRRRRYRSIRRPPDQDAGWLASGHADPSTGGGTPQDLPASVVSKGRLPFQNPRGGGRVDDQNAGEKRNPKDLECRPPVEADVAALCRELNQRAAHESEHPPGEGRAGSPIPAPLVRRARRGTTDRLNFGKRPFTQTS